MLNCKEFVNADSIALGLSPFNSESVSFEAGRIMLQRIHQLMEEKVDFAFETTLAAKSYIQLIKAAKTYGYETTLLYFWLNSPEFAKQRVASRVIKGGHNIPDEIIERRYYSGIYNLFNLYIPVCDNWMIIDNMDAVPDVVAYGGKQEKVIINNDIWEVILEQSNSYGERNNR
jgi:predicted ABC-type ATPase